MRDPFFSRDVELGKTYDRAQSGNGSRYGRHIIPFINYLKDFITTNKITSMLEASSGHWRSGWQSQVDWPSIKYYGVDINRSVVEDNNLLLSQTDNKFGFSDASFSHGDILRDNLPAADLFLCKDTLIHFSNHDIEKFLNLHLLYTKVHKYKHLMFVNDLPREDHCCDKPRPDIPTGAFSRIKMSCEPFNMSVSQTFRYRAFGSNKIVEIISL